MFHFATFQRSHQKHLHQTPPKGLGNTEQVLLRAPLCKERFQSVAENAQHLGESL